MIPDFIDLKEMARDTPSKFAGAYSSFSRIQSYILLHSLGLPVLDGCIVRKLNHANENRVARAISDRGWEEIMVRSDTSNPAHDKPRGGNIVSVNKVMEEIRRITRDGRAAWLLEPVSRFDDLYSGNILFTKSEDWFRWELVGPGFDASDLNRGDTTPHETFLTSPVNEVDDRTRLSPLDLRDHRRIDEVEYQRSWEDRMKKVGRMAPKAYAGTSNVLNRGRRYLSNTGHTLLLDAEVGYKPISYDRICKVYDLVADLPRLLPKSFRRSSYSVSFGYLLHRGLVFWDVFSPQANI